MQLLSDPLPNPLCPQTSHLLNSFNNPLRLIHAARMLNGVEPSSGVRSTTRIHTLKSNLLFLPWETIKWECCLVWSWASAISQLLGVQGCSGPFYPGDTVLLWFSPPQHLTVIPCLYHHGPRVLGERDGTHTSNLWLNTTQLFFRQWPLVRFFEWCLMKSENSNNLWVLR